jgi:PAS domain S-box-containing protein
MTRAKTEETILLVDDNPTNLQVLYQTLEGHGYKLLIAKNGEAAITIAAKVKPALILLDIMMPGMDGYEVCRNLKAAPALAESAVIFLSALDDVKDKVKGFELGAVDYIAKPFQAEEVIARVNTHIKIRQLEKSLEEKNLQLTEDNSLILETMGEGLLGINKQGMITFINPAGCEITGWLAQEIIDKSLHSLLMHTDTQGHRNPLERNQILKTLHDGRSRQSEKDVFWTKDSRAIPVEYTVTVIGSESLLNKGFNQGPDFGIGVTLASMSDITGACVVFKDISERQQRQQALQAALTKVEELKEKLQAENNYLKKEILSEKSYAEIIGQSKALKSTLDEVLQVAPTDTTVIVYGESGTGKESIARAIHQHSQRKEYPLIKVNCGAIPETLVESELFGHVKGAFTSAIKDRIGHFELADKGTIFLDEIGELSLDVQVKLLRVLQEQEIQRVGSSEVMNVDVRIIAATNRDLKQMVDEGKFRMDLFYRLSVFPLTVPALRERKSDIPLLTEKFLHDFSNKLGKPLHSVSKESQDLLMDYHWPGNIRELQNVIERSSILSKTDVVEIDDALVPVANKHTLPDANDDAAGELEEERGNEQAKVVESHPQKQYKTLAENEKSYITSLLNDLNWIIGGKTGAAEILGVPASTLRSRMKKLGIERPH